MLYFIYFLFRQQYFYTPLCCECISVPICWILRFKNLPLIFWITNQTKYFVQKPWELKHSLNQLKWMNMYFDLLSCWSTFWNPVWWEPSELPLGLWACHKLCTTDVTHVIWLDWVLKGWYCWKQDKYLDSNETMT